MMIGRQGNKETGRQEDKEHLSTCLPVYLSTYFPVSLFPCLPVYHHRHSLFRMPARHVLGMGG